MHLLEKIGEGATAEVYAVGTDRVVKLYRPGYPLDSVRQEYRNARDIASFELPMVHAHALVRHAGRTGILYDRAEGPTLLETVLNSGDVTGCGHALSTLHRRILRCAHPEGPDRVVLLRQNIERAQDMSAAQKRRWLERLGRMPAGDRLCHGDFHPGNVLCTAQGHVVIDYRDVCTGHPLWDIARTWHLIEKTPVPPSRLDRATLRAMKAAMADAYLRGMGVTRAELAPWLPVVAAARLAELRDGETEERRTILADLGASDL